MGWDMLSRGGIYCHGVGYIVTGQDILSRGGISEISGGSYTWNERDKSVEYSCPAGKFPYPMRTRKCTRLGLWEKQNVKAECKDVRCPSPSRFENGDFYPRKTVYTVGDVLTFECWGGHEMKGPENRTCQENGKWSEKTTICEDHGGYCPNPGVPLGTTKEGISYNVEDIVKYNCKAGLKMFGSNERECLENKQWSGTEPSCRGMTNSALRTCCGSTMSQFCRFWYRITRGQGLKNEVIYILSCLQISSFDIEPRYAIISYASEANTIVSLFDDESLVADDVTVKLRQYPYSSECRTQCFLHTLYQRWVMGLRKYNMGGDPRVEIQRIRNLLDVGRREDPREDYLDVYVFGLGSDIDQSELNDLASKKDREQHSFHLKDVNSMKEESNKVSEQFPWIAKITITRGKTQESCKGSILTKNFILTAAHCFHFDEEAKFITVQVTGQCPLKVKTIYRHPQYQPESKRDKHIGKSFDYDIAILELEKKMEYSSEIRCHCVISKRLCHCSRILSVVFPCCIVPQRAACLKAAENVKQLQNVTDIRDAVTERFLCTGGTDPVVEPPTCKGDSGGPLIIENKKRYIQVGIISWGTVDHCKGTVRLKTPVPPDSRDFHVNIFHMLPWIKEIVPDELSYLPL
uniref:Complement factor B n=1 Tax=Leptobrachium leishanense TaxID=445787 RepID=A0A8C5PEI7_9ANUR